MYTFQTFLSIRINRKSLYGGSTPQTRLNEIDYEEAELDCLKKLIEIINNMYKYACVTKSESGDDYVYLISSKSDLSYEKIEKWVNKNGNDPGYEEIVSIIDVLQEEFIIIK